MSIFFESRAIHTTSKGEIGPFICIEKCDFIGIILIFFTALEGGRHVTAELPLLTKLRIYT